MASSSRVDMDLSLSLSQQVKELTPRGPMWRPNFITARGPVTIVDSVIGDNEVAAGVGRGILTPRDLQVLGTKSEHMAVEGAMALSVQAAASVANLGQRLLAKNQEVQELMRQVGIQKGSLRDCNNMIRELREELSKEREINALEAFKMRNTIDELHLVINKQKIDLKNQRRASTTEQRRLVKDKADLSRMVDMYSSEMNQKMDTLERSNKRVREDHEKLFSDTKTTTIAAATKEAAIAQLFGGPSVEARGIRMVESRAEAQGSRPTEVDAGGQSAKSAEATVEVQGQSTEV